MAAELCSVADVQANLRISTDSALIADLIERAQRFLASLCDRPYSEDGTVSGWLSASHTDYVTGSIEGGTVTFRYTPVTAVTSVGIVVSATSTSSISTSLLAVDGIPVASLSASASRLAGVVSYIAGGSSFSARFALGEPMERQSFDCPRDNVYKLVYTGGFSTVPDDLSAGAIDMVSRLYFDGVRDPSLTAETLGQHSRSFGGPGHGQERLASLMRRYMRGGA